MATLTKEFLTAGRAIFTLEVPEAFQTQHKTKPHYTFKVRFKKGNDQYKDAYFVNLLTGPDNTKDYKYLGMLDINSGNVRLTGKSCLKAEDMAYKLLCRALARVWANEAAVLEQHGFKLHHMGLCGRCGRPLTTPESVERGIGPECWKYMGGAVTPKKAVHGKPATAAERALDEFLSRQPEAVKYDPNEDYDPMEDREDPDPYAEVERRAIAQAHNQLFDTNDPLGAYRDGH